MRTYDSYKNTEIEWIGEIPRHWEISKVYRHLFMKRGRVISKEEIDSLQGEYPVYSSQTENYGILGYINSYDFDGEYVTWTTDGANAGTCFIRKGKFNTTNVCGLLSPKQNLINLPFLNFLLNIGTKGYVRLDINPKLMNNMMGDIPLILPPLSEQEQIVSYLDEKTSLIDEMVEKKKRKIELLKEYRTSLINTVVTKGLNPNVPMKDSGIEWIGEIPSNWELKRLKYISEIIPSNVDKHIYEDEIQVELCNYTDVYKNDKIDSNTILSKGSCNSSEYDKYHVKLHDVIITKDSESPDDIGIPCLISEQLHNVICGYHLTMLRPTSVDGRYLFRYLLSNYTKSYFCVSSNGMTRYGLGKSSIEDLFTTIPPLSEQVHIVSYLDEKTSEIDKTIELENKKIELLKEYRQSLISNVVTGKIKVVSE